MSSPPKGHRFGPYEVLESLGEGGMGTVYKARDTRLDRLVALKVPKEQFSQRFLNEAQAIASLNHPNICVLHDVGPNYLVMELLDGAPLSCPLPLTKALDIGADIADALDSAHRKGIVHRDLKPSNIVVTRQGVKLLDFGLAKSTERTPANGHSATLSITGEGVLVGTPEYMAPEQIEGRPVDARTDIFALGCVLYEMVTGQRPFKGKTLSSIVAAVLAAEPEPVSQRQPLSPVGLDVLISKCLAKDPEDRWQSARDVAFQLRQLARTPAQAAHPRTSRLQRGAIALLLVGLAGVGATVWKSEPASQSAAYQLSILPTPGTELTSFGSAISPDGNYVVFSAEGDGRPRRLWLRAINSVTPRALDGTDGAMFPFWSPDSHSIGYFSNGWLRRIDVITGENRTLCRATNGRGGSWNESGVILFSPNLSSPVRKIHAAGGEPSSVTTFSDDRKDSRHNWPQFLPGGNRFIVFVRSANPANTGTYAGSLDRPEALVPIEGLVGMPFQSVYAQGRDGQGHLIFVRERSMYAQPFDVKTSKLYGQPKLLHTRDVLSSAGSPGFLNITASANGLLLDGGAQRARSQLIWRDRSGKVLKATGPEDEYLTPKLSHDEKRIAVTRPGSNWGYGIWIADTAKDSMTPFTFDRGLSFYPVWSRDDKMIYYSSDVAGNPHIFSKPVDGSSDGNAFYGVKQAQRTNQYGYSVSDDGRFLIAAEMLEDKGSDLIIIPVDGSPAIEYLRGPAYDLHGAFAPGLPPRWIAYTSDESGVFQVYIRAFTMGPAAGSKWQVSVDGGSQPRWRGDGKELFFVSPEGKMMSAAVRLSPTSVETDPPKVVFDVKLPSTTFTRYLYDVTRDGERFITLGSVIGPRTSSMTLVVNWTSFLQR